MRGFSNRAPRALATWVQTWALLFVHLGFITISVGDNDRADPDVTYNSVDDEYLVVWMEDISGDDSHWVVSLHN